MGGSSINLVELCVLFRITVRKLEVEDSDEFDNVGGLLGKKTKGRRIP